MTIANIDTVNLFTQAQSVQSVDCDTLTILATGALGRTFDYVAGNTFSKYLDHLVHTVGSPYMIPVPTGMPAGYVWTVILIQDAAGGARVRLPAVDNLSVVKQLFPVGVPLTYGIGSSQISVVSGIYMATISKFLCSPIVVYG